MEAHAPDQELEVAETAPEVALPREAAATRDAQPSGSWQMTADAEATLRAKLMRTFETFDKDGSGEVSTSEITQMLHSLGVDAPPEKIELIMKEADTDGSVSRTAAFTPRATLL